MRIVCDSSAMIWCGKLGLLRYLEKLCEVIVIPKGVEQEFQTGLKIGYRDAYQRMSFIQSQKVKNKTANKRIVEALQRKYGFSPCDAEVLAIAKQGYLVMSDDQHILDAMAMEKLQESVFTTADFVLFLSQQKIINKKQVHEIIKLMHLFLYPRAGILKIEQEVGL